MNPEDQPDPGRDKLVAILNQIPGCEVVTSCRAPHCGAVYIRFIATTDALKVILKAMSSIHQFMSVHLDDKNDTIFYMINLSSGADQSLINILQGNNECTNSGNS